MKLIMFVFDPDGSFMMINGQLPNVHCHLAHKREEAMDNHITNQGISRSAADQWQYVCTGFDKNGHEYKVYKVHRLWPVNKYKEITMHRVWPTNDPIFRGVTRLTLMETS